MANHREVRVKLTNTQLNKLKSAVKNKPGTKLRMNQKNFGDEKLPHELILTTKESTKIRNAFANNISEDIKLSKPQVSKIIQSGGSFGSWLSNLGKKKALTNVAISLAKDILTWFSKQFSSAINKVERKIRGKEAVEAAKGFTLFILNEDVNGIIKIMK